ncbi:hypothetical protein LIER_35387 [Lithospermum erythrorhizon]|uniref:Uncharacterized protein n=1 Tax=Lithospermum erythrorhizon TaxID=34254 RepID=A0AAV3NTN9_LITER
MSDASIIYNNCTDYIALFVLLVNLLLRAIFFAQILLGLPPPYSSFVTVMNNTRPMPSFAALRPMLLSEEDRVKLLNPDQPPASTMVLYSSQIGPPNHQSMSNKGGPNNRGRYNSNRGRYSNYRYQQSRPRYPQYGSQVQKSQFPRGDGRDGLLGPRRAPPPPLKNLNQYLICQQHNHTSMECTQRFNHSYTSRRFRTPLLHSVYPSPHPMCGNE